MKIIMASPEEIAMYAPMDWLKRDLEVLPVEEEGKDKLIGWKITETIGMSVINPSAITRMSMGIDPGVPIEEALTEEEKETRRIENKGW